MGLSHHSSLQCATTCANIENLMGFKDIFNQMYWAFLLILAQDLQQLGPILKF